MRVSFTKIGAFCIVFLLGACSQNSSAPIAIPKQLQHTRIFRPLALEDSQRSIQAVKELKRSCPPPHQLGQQERVTKLFKQALLDYDEKNSWPDPLVLSCQEVNALSFTSIRQVVVFEGLLKLNLTDDELSFILAHEIAHHLKLPSDLLEYTDQRDLMFSEQVEKLRANCEQALKRLEPKLFKAGLEKCRQTVKIWQGLNQGIYSQEVEQFVDEVALDVLRRSGIDASAAISAMTKINADEQTDRPALPTLIESAWSDSFRSHPPAWKRLEYLKYRTNYVSK